jgi:heptosyltransferase I
MVAGERRELRVLIVRTSAMGDVLHALPAVAALRRLHPEWFIGWVIDPRWMPLLEAAGCCAEPGRCPERPIVDRIHRVPTQAWKHRAFSMDTVHGIRRLRRELRAERYDLCVDMQGLIRSSLVGSVSGAGRFVGRSLPREAPARWLYRETVPTPAAHVIEQGCELVSGAIGERLAPGRAELPVDRAAELWVDEWLERTLPRELWGRFAFVAPTAGWGAKTWPAERYGAVAVALAEAGWATLVNAAPAKNGIADAAAEAVVTASLGCAVAAPSTLAQMTALLRRAALVIAGDTGPLHLAAALGRPVVALYGPTDPVRTGPYGTRSRVLRHASSVVNHSRTEATEQGLALISTAEVVAAALELLRESEERRIG